MNKYGLRLKELREKNGYTQDALAEELHTTRSRIANYEQGTRQPDFEMQEAIADLFNVSIDYLFGRSKVEKYSDSPEKVEEAMKLYEQFSSLTPEYQETLLKMLEAAQIAADLQLTEKDNK